MQPPLAVKEYSIFAMRPNIFCVMKLIFVVDQATFVSTPMAKIFNVKSSKGGGDKSLIVVMKRGLGGVSKSFSPDKSVGRGRPALAILKDSIEKENFENSNESKVAEGDEKIIHAINVRMKEVTKNILPNTQVHKINVMA